MKRRKRTLVLSLVVVLSLLGVIKLLSNQFNQPSVAQVNSGQPKATNPTYSIDLTPKLFVSTYAQFDYPRGLVQQKKVPLQPPTLEQINFLGRDTTTWLLGISISNLPGGDLNNDSSFTLRQNNPTVYGRMQLSVHGSSVIVMTDKSASDFNQVAFLPHGNQVAAIALSGNDAEGSGPLVQSLHMVISSWSWH